MIPARRLVLAAASAALVVTTSGCGRQQTYGGGASGNPDPARSVLVTATAYNSTPAQTSGNPTLAAWGDTLRPGMRSIAVSQDLVAMGLTRGTEVRIEGLDGRYTVLDRMPARKNKQIDIYMGNDVARAREWGAKKVRIYWRE